MCIYVTVDMMLFDDCTQVLSINHKFEQLKDRTLWYTAIDDERN